MTSSSPVHGSHLSGVWFSVTPLEVSHGKGCWVTTTGGEEYLDFAAGIAVNSTGHAHPAVAAAIAAQAQRFMHAQVNVFKHDLLEPLASRLAELTPGAIDTFFFANSGAEITEGAIKLAKQATKRPHTIVFSGSFHGRTHMAMAMTTSKTGYRAGHAPLPSGVFVAPYPDPLADDQDAEVAKALFGFDHLLKSMTAPDETAAVILEPVLGEGGYIPAPPAFIHGIVERCRAHGILFIADEVQSGFGRTGKMFAVEHYGIEPDIICMAKGIASGFPFAALGTRRELDDKWPKGSHGGTYGGNPMGCAAALATIDVLTAPGFLDNVNARGQQLQAGIRELQREHGTITQVRGLGLMVGTEFDDPARVAAVTQHCLTEGHLILMNAGTYGKCLRWMPPLVVDEREIDLALAALSAALKAPTPDATTPEATTPDATTPRGTL
ncbi:MAG: aminotransferase class III-fold pyridoxal phosphate-dependent enzyme [Actinomycetota bacterium]|nr:aminotransferase class III-fold pyridoxal phosphate-dependent enzyme [Actinomycetota bacterium]